MSYTNAGNERVCEAKTTLPVQPMGEVMKETRAMAEDALTMIRRINDFFFNDGAECVIERPMDTACFRDELMNTRYILGAACEELARLSNKCWPT